MNAVKFLYELDKFYNENIKKITVFEEIQPFCNEVEFTSEIKTANFLTEASMVKNSKRMILGPGPVTAHEVNEHITVESYKKLVEQYKEFINRICM